MKFSVSEIFTFCCQSSKKLYVCWRSIIRLLAFYVCWQSIIRLRVTDFERFYVCWRSIIRLLAFYVCWRSIIRLLAFYVCRRFTFAGATGPPLLWPSWPHPSTKPRQICVSMHGNTQAILPCAWKKVTFPARLEPPGSRSINLLRVRPDLTSGSELTEPWGGGGVLMVVHIVHWANANVKSSCILWLASSLRFNMVLSLQRSRPISLWICSRVDGLICCVQDLEKFISIRFFDWFMI